MKKVMDLEQAIRREKNPDVQDLLNELQGRRRQVVELQAALQAAHERQKKFQRAAGISLDSNVHLRISVSRDNKAWQVAHQVEAEVLRSHRTPMGILYEVLEQMVKEVIEGFLEENAR